MIRFLSPVLRSLFKPVPGASQMTTADPSEDGITLKIDAAVQETERAAAEHGESRETLIRNTFDDLFRRMGKHDEAHG